MTTKITVIYDNPTDPQAFEAAFPGQVALVKQVPNLQRVESWRIWPKEDGTPTPAHRLLDLYFADYDAASAAVESAEAATFLANVFELATGGVRIVFAEAEDV